MLRRLAVATSMTGLEVLRGRLVLAMLVVIPSLFFVVAGLTTTLEPLAFELGSVGGGAIVAVPQRHEATLFIGLAATGLLTSFVGLKLLQRDAETHRRLVLCGYRSWELVAAKLAVLLVVVVAISLYVSAALPLVFFDVERYGLVLLGFVAGGWVYGAWGLLVGALIRRELEGILAVALLCNLDAGWLQNPIWYVEAQNTGIIRALPMHLPSQASMGAAFTTEPLWFPFLGSIAYGLVLLALALAVYAWRMRRR